MLNLVVEKKASEDRDQTRSSISYPRRGTSTTFVRRFGLDFGL